MRREKSLFVQRLSQLMEEKNLTQVELAEKIGITNVTISRYLSGERKPRVEIVAKLANVLDTTVDFLLGNTCVISSSKMLEAFSNIAPNISKRSIPVLGIVKAGYNYLAHENVIDYIEPAPYMSDIENYFGLIVKGESMSPLFSEGDYVVVHKQDGEYNTNDVCVVLINGDEATIKKIVKTDKGIELHAFNPYFPVRKFTFEEIEQLPVKILRQGSSTN